MIEVDRQIDEHIRAIEGIHSLSSQIAELGELMVSSLRGKGKIIWMGNGSDVVVGISTPGNSRNVIEALTLARENKAATIGFTSAYGGRMKDLADHCVRAPSSETARIQETHILIGHLLCDWVEASFVDEG